MSEDDYHLRHQVIDPKFSEEDDRVYEQAMQWIEARLQAGESWPQVAAQLPVADPELRAIICDDFIKITLAKRHFQLHESLKQVAKSLRLPLAQLIAAKESMLKEVSDAAVSAYHLSRTSSA